MMAGGIEDDRHLKSQIIPAVQNHVQVEAGCAGRVEVAVVNLARGKQLLELGNDRRSASHFVQPGKIVGGSLVLCSARDPVENLRTNKGKERHGEDRSG